MLHKLLAYLFISVLLFLSTSCAVFAQQSGSYSALEKPLSYEGQSAVSVAQELIAKKDYKAAMKQAEAAIKSDPKSGIPLMIKGFILDRENDSKKASSIYAKAASLSPSNGYVLNAYGAHLCEKGQFELADSFFLRAAMDSNYPLPY
ncbi:MAG: hypothetical protein ABI644_05080, partial [Arenimonas sp.]